MTCPNCRKVLEESAHILSQKDAEIDGLRRDLEITQNMYFDLLNDNGKGMGESFNFEKEVSELKKMIGEDK